MSIVDCAHHAEVRTHAKRKLQLHCQLQAAHILAASAASLLISFFIHEVNMPYFNMRVHSWCSQVYRLISKYDIPILIYLSPPFSKDKTPHVSGSWPQTRAWYKSFDGYGSVWLSLSIFESMKCNIKWFTDFAEHEANFWMSEWLANIQRNQMNHDSSLWYYTILICILLKLGRKTSTTIFTTFKLGTFPWTCRVHFKNMSHIDLVKFETNVSWWLFCVFWLFYRIAILPCAGGALLLQIHPQVVSSAASSFQTLRTVAKQGAPHTSQGCSSQPGSVGGWSCARIPCHTDFTFDIVPWDLTSTLRVIHSTPSQKRYLEIVLLLYVHCFFVSFRSIHEHLSSLCQW